MYFLIFKKLIFNIFNRQGIELDQACILGYFDIDFFLSFAILLSDNEQKFLKFEIAPNCIVFVYPFDTLCNTKI